MGDPVGASRRAAAVLADGGSALIVEPMAGNTVEENFNPIGRTFAAASTLCCTSNSLALDGPALGAVASEAAIRGMPFDLLSAQYECNTASMAEEALQYVQVEKYDAILTDIAMPGLTGVELLQKVREHNPDTPVILISGKGSEQDPNQLMALG